MKPKDLKSPYSWEERRPLLHQGVLFVPTYYSTLDEWQFPGWKDPQIFGKEGSVAIEYCTGNGAWILEKALQYPDKLWVAVEKRFDRIRKIWSKKENYQLKNLFIVCGEAFTFTHHYLPENSVKEIYINFPDPWPKEKHAKNRLIQPPFINELARISQKEAELMLVTDDETYSEQMISVLQGSPDWKSKIAAPFWKSEFEGYGTSYFDELWREKGRNIRYLNYVRKYDQHQ